MPRGARMTSPLSSQKRSLSAVTSHPAPGRIAAKSASAVPTPSPVSSCASDSRPDYTSAGTRAIAPVVSRHGIRQACAGPQAVAQEQATMAGNSNRRPGPGPAVSQCEGRQGFGILQPVPQPRLPAAEVPNWDAIAGSHRLTNPPGSPVALGRRGIAAIQTRRHD